jgi:hypothetical protein
MNPILQLLISQAPSLIAFVGGLVHRNDPAAPVPTNEEVIMAFQQLFADSSARDAFLIEALKAEIAAGPAPTPAG